MYLRLILLIHIAFTISYAGSGNDKVDGEYIMHHIQDDRVFEIFNPLDWNDSNKDNYYYTSKVKLDKSWNKLDNIPFISNYFSWVWDPSNSLEPMPSNNQLILSKQLKYVYKEKCESYF